MASRTTYPHFNLIPDYSMNNNLFLIWLLLIVPLQDSYCGGNEPVPGNNKPQKRIDRSVVSGQIQQNSAVLDRFAAKCEKRTEKALRRMQRYEEKLAKSVISKQLSVNSDQLAVNSGQLTNGQENNNITPREGPGEASSTGREPLLDSLRLAYGFAQQAGLAQEAGQTGRVWKSIAGAQEQLDITNRTKAELHRQKEKWKAEAKNHPE